jgi:hypothetical protein
LLNAEIDKEMEVERLVKEGIMPVTESEKADSFDEVIFTN